ncbi:MAG: arginine--tRNA ligase [bacterium]|nr:arginine--tRNA ligase [bacterium]
MDQTSPETSLRDAIRRAAARALELEPESVPLTYPPKPELGDLATPVCFELARVARRAPRDLAQAIVGAFEPGNGIARVEVAGGGYINAFLERGDVLRRLLADEEEAAPEADGAKIIVEHTNINPNKAAHIGHLRNAVLGDTLVRFQRRLGRPVEVQNYIDDTGVQVADLVVGFRVLRGLELDDVRQRYSASALRERNERFDYVAWDLYAEVGRHYADDEARLTQRAETLHAMEQGDNPVAELAAFVAHRMVQHHLTTMHRLGIRYDVLTHESDILRLRFWDQAFEQLKSAGAIHEAAEGKNAGCWVMDLPGVDEGAGEDQKVIVRSNGTVTYVGKDIAYQMWKFGLLGRDFRYRRFDWSPQDALYDIWTTCSDDNEGDAPSFGEGQRVYNVIDVRQSYLQRVVTEGLRSLGHDSEAERSVHFSYEMVALTPAAVAAMLPGHELTEEDRGKAFVEMSGRKGLGVRADDLIDTLIERAEAEVRKRQTDVDDDSVRETARRIAVGALRYYMLRYTKNRVVAFDLDAALAFEGETGPYLQYSVVRARNILSKTAERHGADSTTRERLIAGLDLEALPPETLGDHWGLVQAVLRSPATVRQAVESLELATVAKHAYVLAQKFNSFYHSYHVAAEKNEAVRTTRAAIVAAYHDGMVQLLDLMGISVPERM